MRSRSLLGQIVLSAGSGVLVFVGIWTGAAILWLYSEALIGLERAADSQSRELSAALAPLVWNLDSQSIQGYLDTKAEDPEILDILVRDPTGGHVWKPVGEPSQRPGDTVPTTARRATIEYDGQQIGELSLTMTLGPRQRQVAQSVLILLLSLLLLFLAILGSIALSWGRVTSRLRSMVTAMEAFSADQGHARMGVGRNDELGVLARGFNAMADRIEANTRSMEHEIQERTDKLMESEKLALVGSLVAGVAHEINTPIGNGITVSSWLTTRTREVREAQRQGGIAADDLEVYLTDVETSLAILQSGLDRTSNLIQSFKKIGADQVVDERRPLNVATFLNEVVTSLRPTLKPHAHQVVVKCPEDLTIENHPGALFQIVTNLVLNAHHHAFGPTQEGTITVSASVLDDRRCTFEVHDDGVGMDEVVQSKVFQPFFTTKRLEGGTGLGLSIVHSLVQNLGGTIELISAPGRGATFVVTLPRTAPDR